MTLSFVRLSDPPTKESIKSAPETDSFERIGWRVDGLVGSATISPSGRDVALASPEGLAIIDLDTPFNPPRRLSSHGLPWLVVDVQWSPFAARDYWVASTANHRCLVWNLNKRDDSANGAIEHSLEAHSRAITDVNFSAHHPDSLATCAVDGYVYCWDLRRPRQPVLAFCDWFAGATQVKYNRQDPFVLASAHDRWLHIWDIRKSSEPLKTIDGHSSKIYGIDWNRTNPTCLVTCSLDKSIKFWDYGKDDETPQRVIRTDFPVWRARHTPFGHGLLAMPQTEPGTLFLYDQHLGPETPVDGPVDPVFVFPGHGAHKTKEFLWRSRGGVTSDGIDNREFQLVSWGEDNHLRLNNVDHQVLKSVGHAPGTKLMKNLVITRRGATYKTFRTVDDYVPRDRRSPTMSDRPGSGGQGRQSALSSGLSSGLRRVGPSWRPTSMKAKTNKLKPVDKTQLQIGWMKGITMSKRKSGSDPSGRGEGGDSNLFSPGYDGGWGEPETVHDELIRISNQLPNIKWENIDIDSLLLNASLKGPWGAKSESIFIKVRVDIPKSYPKHKAPRFSVEKSSFMPDEIHQKLERELHELGDRLLQRKQNSLYTAFTYLLGETDLEASIAYFDNVRDLEDDEALADESSSEEDENDIPGGGLTSMSQELSASTELDPSATLVSTQRQAVTPLPMFCGAKFSNDGRLVCFFPPKDAKAKALFSVPHPDPSKEKPKGEPTFAGFGRLSHDSPPPKRRFHDETSATDDQSGESDDSDSTTSTDSEPTTVHKLNLWYQPGRRFRKTWSTNESIRSSGGGTGAGTGTGTGTSRKRPGKPKNVISIHNLQNELPSKKQLAQEYAIFGDGADVCNHNAEVAAKYGYQDLVHVWKYAALLLRRDIPLEIHDLHQSGQSVLVIARDAIARTEEEHLENSTVLGPHLAGRVKWGHHPLAGELIRELFDYFEKIADVQMLAMLACIFGDYSIEDEMAIAASHLPQPKTPLPMKAPSFSLEYFPTDPTLWGLGGGGYKSQASSAITTPRTANTPAMYSDPPSSENISGSLEPKSYSCGETPPNPAREHLRDVGHTQSLSTSPNNKFFHRSNSTVAAAIAASLPRALAGIVSGSPPDTIRKRLSPAENMLNTLTPNAIGWPGSTPGPDTPGTSRTSLSDDEYWRDDMLSMVPIAVSCVAENQGLFDDDGWMSTPLIDCDRFHIYSNYRYAYAEMLQMWGQPLSRLEIMKFDVLKEDKRPPSAPPSAPPGSSYTEDTAPNNTPFYPTGTPSPTSPFADRRGLFRDLLDSGRGVDITGFCRVHPGTPLEPAEYLRPTAPSSPSITPGPTTHRPAPAANGAVGVCYRCSAEREHADLVPQTELDCVYCWEPIVGLYAACLACGCVTHNACLAEWHALGGAECPAGHECCCVEQASSESLGSWAGLRAAAAVLAAGDDDNDDDDDDREGGKKKKDRDRKRRDWERGGGGGGNGSGGGNNEDNNNNDGHAARFNGGNGTMPRSSRSRRKSAPAETAKFQHLLRRMGGDSQANSTSFDSDSPSHTHSHTLTRTNAPTTHPRTLQHSKTDLTATPIGPTPTTSTSTTTPKPSPATGGYRTPITMGIRPSRTFAAGTGSSLRRRVHDDSDIDRSDRSTDRDSVVSAGLLGGRIPPVTVAGAGLGSGAVSSGTESGGAGATIADRGGGRRRGGGGTGADSAGTGTGVGPGASSAASAGSGASIATKASGLLAGVKPPVRGEEPVSAAQLSLGKRLKKQLEESGRPGVPRRNSGGLAMWKSANTGN